MISREEGNHTLPLPMDRKSSHRDQRFSIFTGDKMRKITDLIFSKKRFGAAFGPVSFLQGEVSNGPGMAWLGLPGSGNP